MYPAVNYNFVDLTESLKLYFKYTILYVIDELLILAFDISHSTTKQPL